MALPGLLHRSVKYFFWTVSVVAATVVAGAGLVAWRLSEGPIDLAAVQPYIEEALSPSDSSYSVAIDSTVVAWAGWNRLLDLRARGILLVDRQGRTLAAVPEASLTLSGRALLRGVLAPRSLELIAPRLRLAKGEDGGVRLDLGGDAPLPVRGEESSLADLVERSLDLEALERIGITSGSLEVRDEATQAVRRLSHITGDITRLPQGLVLEARGLLPDMPEPARVRVAATYEPASERLAGRLTVDEIVPARLAGWLDLPALTAATLPISGVVEGAWTARTGLQRLSLDLAGGLGQVALPQPIGKSHTIAASHLRADFDPRAKRLTVEELYLDLKGPRVTLQGLAEEQEDGSLFLRADARVEAMPMDALGAYWPEEVADGARKWVVGNIEDGMVREATLTLAGTLPPGAPPEELQLRTLKGSIRPEGATVHYLRPLPPVRGASARVVYDADTMRISLEGGQRGDIRVQGGEVVLRDLRTKRPVAEIDLDLRAPLAAALDLLDREPLGYTSRLGLSAEGVGGAAEVDLALSVPLLKGVRLDDVTVAARARLREVVLPPVISDLGVTDGNVELAVDVEGMDVTGAIALAGIPMRLEWRENFTDNAAFRSRYHLHATLDESQRRRIGLDMAPFVAPYLSGPVGASVVATAQPGRRYRLEADLDLGQATLAVPQLGWHKASGRPGSGQVTALFEGERLSAVERFVVTDADGLDLQGRASLSPEGTVSVLFDRIRHGRTDAAGELVLLPSGDTAVALRGASFDALPLRGRALPAAGEGQDGTGEEEGEGALRASLALERLWLSETGALLGVNGRVFHDGDSWREAFVSGATEGGGRLEVSLAPGGNGRVLRAESDDAGGVLAALGIAEEMRGGRLVLAASGTAAGKAEGQLTIEDFRLVDAPLLARVLNLASITGVVDVLRGEGLRFERLLVPFRWVEGVVSFSEARAWGMALGLTADGTIDLRRDRLEVAGTVVPMYMVNGVLGYVPFLGALVSPEKGGGLFAATYSVKGTIEEPDIDVNPLTTFAPGVLRRLFGLDGR